MGVEVGRAADRRDYDEKYHFIVIDDDLDRFEAGQAKIDSRLASLQRIGIGLLVSMTTAAIMLALNLMGAR